MNSAHPSDTHWTKRRWPRPIAGAAVGLASLIGSSYWTTAAEDFPGRSDLVPAIEAKLAALNIKPRTVEMTSELARKARAAIKREDYATAGQITAAVLANSQIENWRFYPF
jgi:hypothetical protein